MVRSTTSPSSSSSIGCTRAHSGRKGVGLLFPGSGSLMGRSNAAAQVFVEMARRRRGLVSGLCCGVFLCPCPRVSARHRASLWTVPTHGGWDRGGAASSDSTDFPVGSTLGDRVHKHNSCIVSGRLPVCAMRCVLHAGRDSRSGHYHPGAERPHGEQSGQEAGGVVDRYNEHSRGLAWVQNKRAQMGLFSLPFARIEKVKYLTWSLAPAFTLLSFSHQPSLALHGR